MNVKRLIAVALIGGLIAGGITTAEAKKKRKKKKKKPVPVQVDTTYFLRADSAESVDAANLHLSIEDGADAGNGYGWAEYGAWNEAFGNAGQDDLVLKDIWPATDGLPLKLDASKKAAGTLYLSSWNPGSAAGQTASPPGRPTLDVELTGDVGGETISLGTASVTYDLSPTSAQYEVKFEIELADELDKKQLTALTMTVTQRGAAQQHGSYELDDPASFLVVPSWKVKKR